MNPSVLGLHMHTHLHVAKLAAIYGQFQKNVERCVGAVVGALAFLSFGKDRSQFGQRSA